MMIIAKDGGSVKGICRFTARGKHAIMGSGGEQMSRKSRVHVRERQKMERSFANGVLIVLSLVLAAYFALSTAMLLKENPRLIPIAREEAVRADVTLLEVTRVHTKGWVYRFRFADHEPLNIGFGKENIKGAKNWPAGTRLTLLTHPLDESYVISLTKDGEELIRFDDYLAFIPRAHRATVIIGVICYGLCAAGAVVLGVWYVRRRKEINGGRR